jgi:drug/metabolite transporter (DMT)-like permease
MSLSGTLRGFQTWYLPAVLLGVFLALLTSIAWAFGNVFVQRSSRAVGEARSLMWLFVLGGLLSAVAVPLFDRATAPVDAAAIGWLIAAGVSSLAGYGGMFFAFSRGDLTLTVPFVSCWSMVAGIIGLVVFGERPGPLQLVGAAVVFAGVLLVALGSGDAPGPNARIPSPWARAAAVLAGVGFGVMFPAMSQAAPAFGTFGAATLVYAICLLLGLPVALLAKLDLRRPPRSAWPVLLGTGLFETVGFILLTAAGLVAPLSVVAPVASLAAAFTVIYAFVFLHERPGRRALLGAVLASVGVVVLSVARS